MNAKLAANFSKYRDKILQRVESFHLPASLDEAVAGGKSRSHRASASRSPPSRDTSGSNGNCSGSEGGGDERSGKSGALCAGRWKRWAAGLGVALGGGAGGLGQRAWRDAWAVLLLGAGLYNALAVPFRLAFASAADSYAVRCHPRHQRDPSAHTCEKKAAARGWGA